MIIFQNYKYWIQQYLKSKNNIPIYKINKYNTIRFIPMGLDIETTTQYKKDEQGKVTEHYTNMWIWQLSFDNDVFIGRTMTSLFDCMQAILDLIAISDWQTLIFIQNQKFEFQFLAREFEQHFGKVNIFARTERTPMRFDILNKIIFIDSFLLTGFSLEKIGENYTKTKKLVGDLDYNIIRNSKTPITKEELNYCINDVVILKEYAEFYEEQYLKNKFMPMTATMIAGKVVKDEIKLMGCQKFVNNLMYEIFPKSKKQYDYIMSFYTGAYTHGMLLNLFYTKENGLAYDVTSEYPYVMMNCYYPMGGFFVLKDLRLSETILKNFCCLIDVTFVGIRTKTGITVISKNHCENIVQGRFDNGRLYEAKSVRLHVTEVDLDILKKVYKIEKILINSIVYAKRGYLPNYFRIALAKLIDKKQQLKGIVGKEIEYMQSKKDLNGQYGRCCTKIETQELYFENGWKIKDREIDWNNYWKGKNVAPQWAVWITAHSRALVLSMALEIKPEDYWYTDTDSIKCANKKYIIELFNNKNKEIFENNNIWIDELNLKELFPKTNFNELGTFSREEDLIKFKSLGAKRYICTINENGKEAVKSTIAGLPKKAFLKYCEKNNLNPYECFNDDMVIDVDFSQKLCSYYEDNPQTFDVVDDFGNSETYHTLSYVSLIPTTFKMSISPDLHRLFTEIIT